MATTQVIQTILQFKRGLAEDWNKKNPVLAAGEPGFELDTGKLKIGDGKTSWNSLKYQNETYTLSVDEKSLILNSENKIGLVGYEEAKQGQMLVKDVNKGLAWVNPVNETVFNEAVGNAQAAAAQAGNYATKAGNQAVMAELSAKNAARALDIIQHDIFWFGTVAEYNALESITEDKIYVILT